MLGCSERNASKKALIKAKRRTQQQTKLKEMEEVEEKVEEEKVAVTILNCNYNGDAQC